VAPVPIIVGPVGSGKSSLLEAILGELILTAGIAALHPAQGTRPPPPQARSSEQPPKRRCFARCYAIMLILKFSILKL